MLGATAMTVTVCLLTQASASAQSFEALGTRAQGMGGAFVGVADDASAVYWNPAGLAFGAYVSLVLDWSTGKAEPDDDPQAGSRSANLIALGTPPLGLSYYRLRTTTLVPAALLTNQIALDTVRVQRLTTHHAGVTVVQSLLDHLAVGATLKLVRGIAAQGVVVDGDRDDLLDEAGDLPDAASNKFDADVGVMATFGGFRAGLTIRNVTEPDFETPGDAATIELQRQTRAGISYIAIQGLVLAADIDVERVAGSLGEARYLATGAEAQIVRRAFARAGFRFNTLKDQPGGMAPAYSLGGSFAVLSSLIVDAQVTLGSEAGDRGWGVAGRVVF
jgi:hypothetical protein